MATSIAEEHEKTWRELFELRLRRVEQGLDPFTPRERDYIENGGDEEEQHKP